MSIEKNKYVNNVRNKAYEKPEDKLQEMVFKYLNYHYPHIFAFSIPNGFDRKSFYVQQIAKKTGLKSGVPDIFIAHPKFRIRGNFEEFLYAGLFIELKTETCIMQLMEGGVLVNKKVQKGVSSQEQKEAIQKLNKIGYYAIVTYGFKQTIDVINDYLKEC